MSQLTSASCVLRQRIAYYSNVQLTHCKNHAVYVHSSWKRNYSRKKYSLSRHQLKYYCDILGVPVNASEAKIKQSFYKKSFVYHPDKNKSLESGKRFGEISEAYQALINHKRHTSSEETSKSPWKKYGQRGIRPLYQTMSSASHRAKKAESHHYESFAFEEKTEQSESEKMSTGISNAGTWCNQYYQNQLQKDFSKHKQMRMENEKDKNEGNICVLM